MQGPRSIKVPDLGLSEPRISNLFGTLAQVCTEESGYQLLNLNENKTAKALPRAFRLEDRAACKVPTCPVAKIKFLCNMMSLRVANFLHDVVVLYRGVPSRRGGGGCGGNYPRTFENHRGGPPEVWYFSLVFLETKV